LQEINIDIGNLTLGEKEETYAHFAIQVHEPSVDEETFQKAKNKLYFKAVSYFLEDMRRSSGFYSTGGWQCCTV